MERIEKQHLFLSYEKLLNPEKLKKNLILASLYLTSYEMMRSSIMEHVRGLFILGSKEMEKGRYKREVLQLYPKDSFHATCLWVLNNHGLNAEDIQEIKLLRDKRNQVAHELPQIISDRKSSIDLTWLYRIRDIITKFDRWWIRYFEIYDLDQDTIPDEEISSGNMILMDIILCTVDGRDKELEKIYQYWLNATIDKEFPTTEST